jgi:hypothetical protein
VLCDNWNSSFAMLDIWVGERMKAKEMFEELGFKCEEYNSYIRYYQEFTDFYDEVFALDINFRFFEKKIYSDFPIDMRLLKAINKQIEELGWNESNQY